MQQEEPPIPDALVARRRRVRFAFDALSGGSLVAALGAYLGQTFHWGVPLIAGQVAGSADGKTAPHGFVVYGLDVGDRGLPFAYLFLAGAILPCLWLLKAPFRFMRRRPAG
jgi:hypothetical protein